MKRNKKYGEKNRTGKFLFVFLFCTFVICSTRDKIDAQEIRITFDQISYDELIQQFKFQLNSGNVEQKRDALHKIRSINNLETARLAVTVLRDNSEIVRATAPFSILALPADESANLLLPQLRDKSVLVRRETAYALGKAGSALAVKSLIELMKGDKILEVRTASAVALGEIGDISAIRSLITILNRKPSEKEEFLRRAAARSVGQIAQIIQKSDAVVLTPETILSEKFKDLQRPRYLYFAAQFPIYNEAAFVLLNTLQNEKESEDTKRETAYALGEIGDARAVPLLQSIQNTDDYYLAKIATEAVRKLEFLELLRITDKQPDK